MAGLANVTQEILKVAQDKAKAVQEQAQAEVARIAGDAALGVADNVIVLTADEGESAVLTPSPSVTRRR